MRPSRRPRPRRSRPSIWDAAVSTTRELNCCANGWSARSRSTATPRAGCSRSSACSISAAKRGGAMADLPGSVLFCCTLNAVRSPIAEGLFKLLYKRRVFVDSVGVRAGELDPFAVAVMDEIGIDISRHRSKSFDNLDDTSFDVIISLSPEAHHRALEMTRTMACEVEFWNTFDPSIVEGSREVRLDAYRDVRDTLLRRIRERFPAHAAPMV